MSRGDPTGARRPARARNLVLAGVIAAAFVGYLVGLGGGTPRPDGTGSDLRPQSGTSGGRSAPAAITYAEMAERPSVSDGIDAGPWDARVSALRATPPQKPVLDERAKLASLARRAEGRAFRGAPPTVPHAIRGLTDASCATCHEGQLALGGVPARRPPHEHYAQCTQCHVGPAARALASTPGAVLAGTAFQGLPEPTSGRRAWPGAPPVMPHTTWMRNDCRTCHGTNGWPGIQTSHPERLNCLQCHASGAGLEQAPTAGMTPAFLPAPHVESR